MPCLRIGVCGATLLWKPASGGLCLQLPSTVKGNKKMPPGSFLHKIRDGAMKSVAEAPDNRLVWDFSGDGKQLVYLVTDKDAPKVQMLKEVMEAHNINKIHHHGTLAKPFTQIPKPTKLWVLEPTKSPTPEIFDCVSKCSQLTLRWMVKIDSSEEGKMLRPFGACVVSVKQVIIPENGLVAYQ